MSILLVTWVGFAVAVGMYADNYRNRNRLGWIILSVLISPLLAWALVAAMQPVAPKLESEQRADEQKRFGILAIVAAVMSVVIYFH